MTKHDLARNLLTQEPGRGNRHANAAGNPNIAQDAATVKADAAWAMQTKRLRLAFGLTLQQAAILAALVFGEGGDA